MTTFDPKNAEIKFAIANAAVDLYIEGDGQFYIKDVAGTIDIDPAEVFNYFPNKEAILQFYYTALVYRYRMMVEEIDQFDTYKLSEKFSNFAYTSIDMLQEKEAFVKATFEQLILYSYDKTDFETEVEYLIQEFLESDDQLSASSEMVKGECFYTFLQRKYLKVLQFWLTDESENRELTMELIDKLTSFLQELMYNTIADQGIEMGKFLYSNRKTFLKRVPGLKQLFSKIEIR